MGNDDIYLEPEALRMSVRLNCLCTKDINWMKVVTGTSGSGEPANAIVGLRYECPSCGRQVGMELVVQPPKPE